MSQELAVPDGVVRREDLRSLSAVAGSRFRIVEPALPQDAIALEGQVKLFRLRPGLMVHSSDARHIHDLTTEIVQRQGLTISLFLYGHVDISLGGRSFSFGQFAPFGAEPKAEGVIIAKARPELFVRRSSQGIRIRKVNVTIAWEWLESEGLDDIRGFKSILRFSRDHLAALRWTPSGRLISVAEQILRPPPLDTLLRRLYIESRAIDIVSEALHAVAQESPVRGQQSLRPRDHRRMRLVRDTIEARIREPFTLDELAREVGISITTLQRLFQATHGTTVFEYVRTRKLQVAREALERDGVSVAEAAHVAGFSSPANFATAFKRFFGISPKHVRARI